MSKKNCKYRRKIDNGYPLPDRTVLYSKKKNIQPVPEAGKKYHCFDDGKITFSRHYIMEIIEVLGHNEFKNKYPRLFNRYLHESKSCYWLYSRKNTIFPVAMSDDDRLEVFIRTKQGGWFSISSSNLYCGTLDIDGKLWDNLVANVDRFDYTPEEKEKLIKEGTI